MYNQSTNRTSPWLILIIGIFAGILIAGGFALIKSGLGKKGSSAPTSETKGLLLSIKEPIDGDFVSEKNIIISGTTGNNAAVAVTGGVNDSIVETSNGSFTTNVELAEGENELAVYAFDPLSGESAQLSVKVLFISEETASANSLVASAYKIIAETDQEKIDKLKKQVTTNSSELKKEAAKLKKIHVFGTIAAIAESSFIIETASGSLKTVFTDDLTKFYSIGSGGKTRLNVLEEFKVGDKVSVVGIGSDEAFGTAKYVVRQGTSITKRHAISGKVKEISAENLVLTHQIHTDRTTAIKISSNTNLKIKGKDKATISDIKIGDFVVVCGTVGKDSVMDASKIFVIPGAKTGQKPKDATSSATPSANP